MSLNHRKIFEHYVFFLSLPLLFSKIPGCQVFSFALFSIIIERHSLALRVRKLCKKRKLCLIKPLRILIGGCAGVMQSQTKDIGITIFVSFRLTSIVASSLLKRQTSPCSFVIKVCCVFANSVILLMMLWMFSKSP